MGKDGYLTHFKLKKAKTPFIDVSPVYGDSEFKVFAEQVEAAGGVDTAILVDENGNILDGHTRQRIEPDCQFEIIKCLGSDDHKRAYAFRKNYQRRHLNKKDRDRYRNNMKDTAIRLTKDHSQRDVAAMLGLSQPTISNWANEAGKGHTDKRRTLTDSQVDAIKERVADGETQTSVAKDMGVTQHRVSQIINAITVDNGDTQVKSTDSLSSRATAVRAAIVKGEPANVASGRLGFETTNAYRTAARVAESSDAGLVAAMDDKVLTPNMADKLVGKSTAEVAEGIATAKDKASLKRHRANGCRGKSAADVLYTTIDGAHIALRNYANQGITPREIPRAKARRDELRKLVESFEIVTSTIIQDLKKRLDACS